MTRVARKKLVVVGDGGCGKAIYQNGAFPERYVPTVFENYIANVHLDNRVVELALWDTAGQEDYDRLRPLSYPETNVILICFAIDQPTSFKNVQDRWLPEVTHFCENVPKLLVGTKIDLRDNKARIAHLNALGQRLITFEEGDRLAKEISARYYECSAMRNQYVSDVIEAATRTAMSGGMMRLQKKLFHSGGSIRNDAQAKRKVFKNVLDSPFVMKWPAIPNEVGQSVLTHLITLLEPIGTIRRENIKKKKKEEKQTSSYPEIYKRLRTGNNTITELLEKIIQDKEQDHPDRWTIFVCKRDIQPTQLCNHLLPMCTMAKTKLVPLPEGSVVKIGQALHIPRVSVLALQIKEDNGDNKEEERLRLAVEEVPNLPQTQWLDDATSSKGTYQPTNVKVIQTTAPIKQPKKQPQPQQQQQQKQQKQQKRQQDQSNNNNDNQPNKKIKR
ncbi:hypothetical protein INT45_005988 [Circinella minor]|uniref:Rho GTPase n=1 Tax=Circinella minor TaxID=1195481 RepID=A0A8H7SBW6_9FUNG|nr:hypothetical protein INT45_005988 [Circinella minor]